jgi:subtilisin family serine protease
MAIDERMRAQHQLILNNFDDVAVHPDPDRWDDVDDIDYLYRQHTILVRRSDSQRVTAALGQIFDEAGYGDVPEGEARQIRPHEATSGIVRMTVPGTPTRVPNLIALLDDMVGPGVARPEHKVYVCPYPCPATEPIEVQGTPDPVPPPGADSDNDGAGVRVGVVDTGLMPNAAMGHPWLAGVRGTIDNPYTDHDGEAVIAPYAGHGTFVAGILRCMAPKASIFVERAFDNAGAVYETKLAPILEAALDRHPDILVFTFVSPTHRDQSLHTFDELYERRIRHMKGMVVLAPAGNDGKRRPMWPAAHPGVIAVGALAANGRERAHFTNHGRWVDVYAPGVDLVNAYPAGTFVCHEPPIGERRHFRGMAMWSGTSFSTPLVAGLIAARMSQTGQNAQQAWDSLQRLACSQSIPGVGPVLYPGAADGESGH